MTEFFNAFTLKLLISENTYNIKQVSSLKKYVIYKIKDIVKIFFRIMFTKIIDK